VEFWLSILALAAGPLLFPVAKRHPRLLCGMDGFVLVAIAGLSLFHLLPVAIDHAGSLSLLTALGGVLGPFVFGRNLPHKGQRNVHNIFIILAVAGLAVHAMIDGAALFHGTHHGLDDVHLGGMVAAVLIHRVPMSLLVWWSLRPRMGLGVASGALGLLAVATGAGYVLGGSLHLTPVVMGHLVAFVAGSLVHVVAHDTASELIPRHCHDAWHATYSAIGGAVAAVGLAFFGHLHEFEPAWERFSALVVETAPALLGGFVALVILVGVTVPLLANMGEDDEDDEHDEHDIDEPQGWLDWMDRVSPWLALVLAIAFGLQAAAPEFAVSFGTDALDADHAWWEQACAAVLVAVLVVSYFRLGPRGILGQLFPAGHGHGHDHDHHD
jgi:hypothetical protein